MRYSERMEFWALVLIMLTVALLVWERIGMNRVLTLEPGSSGRVWVESDQDVGGNSKPQFTADDAWTLTCEVVPDIEFPHCRLLVALRAEPESFVDLRRFDELRVTLAAEGNEGRPIPVHLVHMYHDGGSTGGKLAYKVHQQLVFGEARKQSFVVPLHDFVVPAWFAFYNDLSLEEYLPELGRVANFTLESSSGRSARVETIKLFKLEFTGKWVARETLLQAVLGVWLSLLLVFLAYRGAFLKRLMLQKAREKAELEQLNSMLDVRTKELETLATHDPLTGLLNRAGIHNILAECIDAANKGQATFSLVLLDLDRFKAVNDTLGHAVGDEALKALASILASRCRRSDAVARWGGEEFLVVCPETDAQAATKLGQALCDALREARIVEQMPLTCSVGVAAFEEGDIDSLFGRVDKALYKAKADGRDRVHAAA